MKYINVYSDWVSALDSRNLNKYAYTKELMAGHKIENMFTKDNHAAIYYSYYDLDSCQFL